MAEMKLADIFVREIFEAAALENSIRKAVLFGTGVVANDGSLAAKVGANDGRLFTHKFYRDLVDGDPTSMDDSDTLLTDDKISIGSYSVRKIMQAKSWGEKDIVSLIGMLPDPLGAMAGQVSAWWGRYYDRLAIAMLNGVIADNIANDSGDMIHDIGAVAGAGSNVTPTAIVDALGTSGDTYEQFNTMICHSAVALALRKQNLITTIPNSDLSTVFQFYQHMRMIVTDNVNSTAADTYDTIFCRPGVFRYGKSNNGLIPSEVDRIAKSGNGAGHTSLITRSQYAMHPVGFSFTDASVAGESLTRTEAALAANWDRIVTDRKQVGLAVLRSTTVAT